MADYKGRTKTSYTERMEAQAKLAASLAGDSVAIAEPVQTNTPQVEASPVKRRGRPAKK